MSDPLSLKPVARALFDPAAQPWEVPAALGGPVPTTRLSPDGLRLRFQSHLEWAPENPDERRSAPPDQPNLIAAAVLVPLVMRPEGLQVLLTQRTEHLHAHAGQIAFPGGRAEPEDDGPVGTALRETEEETGLERRYVDILGALPDYLTSTGFRVTPVVGLAVPDFKLAHDPFEVADVFEVPLEFLMNPANHRLHTATLVDGIPRRYYSIPFGERFIWGATAGMLRNLYHMLRA